MKGMVCTDTFIGHNCRACHNQVTEHAYMHTKYTLLHALSNINSIWSLRGINTKIHTRVTTVNSSERVHRFPLVQNIVMELLTNWFCVARGKVERVQPDHLGPPISMYLNRKLNINSRGKPATVLHINHSLVISLLQCTY